MSLNEQFSKIASAPESPSNKRSVVYSRNHYHTHNNTGSSIPKSDSIMSCNQFEMA